MSQQEASHIGGNLIPIDETIPSLTARHKKARPSVNVKLAQEFRGQQDLPPIERGGSGHKEVHDNVLSPEVECLEIGRHSRRDEREVTHRDHVTGRMLSEYGRSCLRCTEEELRCTLNFIGKEHEAQCVACQRSKVPYCVRFQPPKEDKKSIPFDGLPWKNPYFVAGTAKTAYLPRGDLEDLLHEIYHGESGYVLGNYVSKRDVCNYVLPPFNGADLPVANRPKNYETMNWTDVLPDWRNRSLRPRQGEGVETDKRERQKKKLALARDRSLLPANLTEEEELEEEKRRNIRMRQVLGMYYENGGDEISFLRILRRYEPREQNLTDVMGETW